MRNILKISAIASAILVPQLVNAQATSPMEVSATVDAGCFLTAMPVNFGNLIVPLIEQTANSSITVKCSNKVNYSVGFIYGNSTGGTANSGVDAGFFTLKKTNILNHSNCGLDMSSSEFNTNTNIFYGSSKGKPNGDVWTITKVGGTEIRFCVETGTIPEEAVNCNTVNGNLTCGSIRGADGSYTLTPTSGKMVGSGGDYVSYQMSKPNSTDVWSSGTNAYNGIGNGEVQTLNYTSKILPNASSTGFLKNDLYVDTSRVDINF